MMSRVALTGRRVAARSFSATAAARAETAEFEFRVPFKYHRE
jgi:hypothetical protein